MLTGVKKGTATITCKQKLKGKTITIGKCKVTVKNATVNATYKAEESLPIGTDTIGGIDTEQIFYIVNRNPNASYTYTTDSSNLTIKEEVVYPPADFIGAGYFYYSQTYTAKKEGTYTVTVTETYKKKSKKIGSFKVIIHPTEIMEQLTIDLNGSESIRALLNYRKTDMNYYIVGDGFDESTKSDDSIIYIASDEYDTNIYGVKEGTAKLNIYEGKSQSEKVLIGTCTVTVNKTATESISFDEESYSTYVGAPENDDTLYIYLYKEPSNASDEVVVSLSDETIAKLVYDEDEEGYKVLPIKEGKVTLKAQCGDKTATCEVTILGNEDEGDFDEESDFEEE